MTDERMCSSGDHSDVPAVGEAQVDEDDPTRYPYCEECLLLCDPPRFWYGSPPSWASGDISEEEGQQLVKAVVDALLTNQQRLRDLHHSHTSLDANARNLIAMLAVDAVLKTTSRPPAQQLQELRDERDQLRAAIVAVHSELCFALGPKSDASIVTAVQRLRAERDHLTEEVTTLSIQSMSSEGEYHDAIDAYDQLLAAMKYLRACAHLFPHTNTDREHEVVGLPDEAPGAWCLGCTVAATADEVADMDRHLLGFDETEEQHNERALQWVHEYETREREEGSE